MGTGAGASLLPEDPASEAASPSPADTAICDPRTGVDHYNINRYGLLQTDRSTAILFTYKF